MAFALLQSGTAGKHLYSTVGGAEFSLFRMAESWRRRSLPVSVEWKPSHHAWITSEAVSSTKPSVPLPQRADGHSGPAFGSEDVAIYSLSAKATCVRLAQYLLRICRCATRVFPPPKPAPHPRSLTGGKSA